jgi:hypothetical protein
VVDKEGFVAMLRYVGPMSSGFLKGLTGFTTRELLADANPTVVANAVAALIEISDRSSDITLRLNSTVAGKLVAALGECSE